MSGLPTYSRPTNAAGNHAPAHAAATQARRSAPTWQEIAEAVRPYLPSLPPPGRQEYARALLAEVEEISGMTFLPAPFRYREEFARALITGACEALKRGDQVAAIHQNPNGTFEVSDIRVPPIRPRKQLTAVRGTAGLRPTRSGPANEAA